VPGFFSSGRFVRKWARVPQALVQDPQASRCAGICLGDLANLSRHAEARVERIGGGPVHHALLTEPERVAGPCAPRLVTPDSLINLTPRTQERAELRRRTRRSQRIFSPYTRGSVNSLETGSGSPLGNNIKKLAKIDGVGHRIHGDRSKGNGRGWEYLHVAIDDHSRLAYSEILPDESGDSSLIFAKNAVQWFRRHGMKLQRIMTDNGVGYKKRYRNRLSAWGIRHITTKPYTPKTNGKAERFIRTSLEEWAYAQPYAQSRERTEALPVFLDFYNNHRHHHGINMQTPISRCEQCHEM
jgi:transposase InsO family protein